VKRFSILIFFIVLTSSLLAQSYYPKSKGEIVKHKYYTLSYNENHEQANWVYYHITPQFINGKVKRRNKFKSDAKVKTKSATLSDYKASGYDRGHLCPAAAMKLNATSMQESFYMSNMSPQKPQFNRGVWKKLEAQVRKWTIIEKDLYVVSGPVFKDNMGTIGKNKVTIPGYYYKVIFDASKPCKMIAFILPNTGSKEGLSRFVVSVDRVEKETGIDFFSQLPDNIENSLENKSSIRQWR